MKKACIGLLLLLSLTSRVSAQGYRIEATLKGLKDTTCILGHYLYSNQQFVAKDTARVDSQGRMVFEGTSELPGGLYLILPPGQRRWVELIYSGQEPRFSLETDTASIVRSMVVKGSKENELYYGFQQEVNKIMGEMEALSLQRSTRTDAASQEQINKKMAELQQQFTDYRRRWVTEHAGTFTASLVKASLDPEIPPAPKLPNGKTDSTWVFNYYKGHFWDNFDFADARLLRTPFVQAKLDRYIKGLVVQSADSLTKEADYLVARASANRDMKTYFIYYITGQYEDAKVVGTESVFVHMAEKYYLTGQMEISEDGKKRIAERVATMKPLLVDKVIPNLTVADTLRRPISLHDIKAEYTVLFFYSPTCGHCKEAAPKLKEFYDANKASGVKVLAVATEHPEEWGKYIKTYKLGELLHGYDFSSSIDYRRQFDVFSTPTIYVLDKNKRIIARRMPIEQLDDFYNFYLRTHPAAPKKSTPSPAAKSGK